MIPKNPSDRLESTILSFNLLIRIYAETEKASLEFNPETLFLFIYKLELFACATFNK